jgi:uncharacterized membrane protein
MIHETGLNDRLLSTPVAGMVAAENKTWMMDGWMDGWMVAKIAMTFFLFALIRCLY